MVSVSKLWGDARFSSLSPNAKLLYIYLCTQASISTLGVVYTKIGRICLDLDFRFKENEKIVKSLLSELKDFVVDIPDEGFTIVIVKDHFKSLSKTKTNSRKALTEGATSPDNLKEKLRELFTTEDFEYDSFTPPTAEEVTDYALSKGFVVNGKQFVEYYGDNDWYDKNDKKVRRWKAKVDKVWCRDESKLEVVEGAPKGYEYFHITLDTGARISPHSWKDGKPMHSNFVYAQVLLEEFQNR